MPIEVPGTTYYVNAATGNDHNDGLSPASALETLAAGVAKLSKAGGDRLVLEGTFQESLSLSDINDPVSGGPDPSLPTVVQCAFDSSGNPRLASIDGGISGAASFPFDAKGLPPGFGPGRGNYLFYGVDVKDCNYVTLSGLDIRGIAGKGIATFGSSHLVVEYVTVEWTAQSAMLFAPNPNPSGPTVRDLTVAHCRTNQTNLGGWVNRATSSGYSMATETISIVNVDGFEVYRNHLSNSMMEGIDFKLGSRNGTVRNNVVENMRSVGIYANEGDDTSVYQNVVCHIGYYDPEDGSGLQQAAPYMSAKLPFSVSSSGATGILINNGDLGAGLETGRCTGIWVFENVVAWILKNGIAVNNQWRLQGKPGWLLDDLHVHNNVVFKSNLEAGAGAIALDVGMTNSTVFNNILDHSGEHGMLIYDMSLGGFYSTNEISYNLFYDNARTGELGGFPRFGDPRFVLRPVSIGDPSDFQLSAGSPAIATGMLAGKPIDIGAYEFQGVPWEVGPGSGS